MKRYACRTGAHGIFETKQILHLLIHWATSVDRTHRSSMCCTGTFSSVGFKGAPFSGKRSRNLLETANSWAAQTMLEERFKVTFPSCEGYTAAWYGSASIKYEQNPLGAIV